jgi:DNA-directed RNA polymerase specialized sigma24 family protein
MSPSAGDLLVEQIAPRLRSAIPKCVNMVGAEDAEELVQDAIAMAARMLHNVEESGKTVTAGNIAYFTILHMKSGRRSQGTKRMDVMAPGTQLDHNSSVLSIHEEVGNDSESDEPVSLGELLATEREDPSVAGARNVDWDQFLALYDYRYTVIVAGIIEDQKLGDIAKGCGGGYPQLHLLKQKLVDDLREFMGDQAIEDSARIPSWRGNLIVDRERAACQADRRRS